MLRMPRINLNHLRPIQHSHKTHIETLRACSGDRVWEAQVDALQAGDFADHVLRGECEVGDLGGGRLGAEFE